MSTSNWRGVVALQRTWTGDGRRVEKITHRDLPLPLLLKPDPKSNEHVGSKIVGRIDAIEYDGDLLRASGIVENVEDLPPGPLGLEADMDQMSPPEETPEGMLTAEARLVAAHIGQTPAWSQCGFEVLP